MHPAQIDIPSLLADCKIQRTRAGGPGGQHRNKVETAIVIVHLPTGLSAQASERRSQEANRVNAIFRLRLKLATHHRTKANPSRSPLWRTRTGKTEGQRQQGKGKISINPDHPDFPAILAEAMNVITEADYDVSEAAQALGLSTSQTVKLLKLAPEAMELVNNERKRMGLRPYK